MAFVPVPNTAQIELRYEYFGEMVENTLYFKRPDGMGSVHLALIVDAVADWWASSLRAAQHTWLIMREVYGKRLNVVDDIEYANTFYAGERGGITTGYGCPGNVSLCISFRTGFIGRQNHGRNYAVAITRELTEGNFVKDSLAATLLLAYWELVHPSMLYPEAMYWGVCSRYPAEPIEEGKCTQITQVAIPNLALDSMKRRLAQRGD